MQHCRLFRVLSPFDVFTPKLKLLSMTGAFFIRITYHQRARTCTSASPFWTCFAVYFLKSRDRMSHCIWYGSSESNQSKAIYVWAFLIRLASSCLHFHSHHSQGDSNVKLNKKAFLPNPLQCRDRTTWVCTHIHVHANPLTYRESVSPKHSCY